MNQNLWITVGIWTWGGVTALLAIIIVVVVLSGRWPDLLKRIIDAATALGAVVAASALAWSYFFQSGARNDAESEKLRELSKLTSELSTQVQRLTLQPTPAIPPPQKNQELATPIKQP